MTHRQPLRATFKSEIFIINKQKVKEKATMDSKNATTNNDERHHHEAEEDAATSLLQALF